MSYDDLEKYYDLITKVCLKYYKATDSISVFELLEECMDLEGLPIHCPPHHYLIPAVLLTACKKADGALIEELEEDLREANSRAHNILGGFCGLYGNCGAAVGIGIFMSIYTGTGPLSEKSWSITNMATAKGLMKIAKIDGPRCCKRNSYLAFISAAKTISETLNLQLEVPEKIVCKYYNRNKECKGKDCPFFPANRVKEPIKVPDKAFPKKDPVNPCPCELRGMNMTFKKGIITWVKEVGDFVTKGEIICEAEVEKKAVEIKAPFSGILSEICIPDEEEFEYNDVLGFIETSD